MTIFDKLTMIVKADINAILARAQNPEKMLEQMLSDMNETIKSAQKLFGELGRQQNSLKAQLAIVSGQARAWEKTAEKAIHKDRDDLAKDALQLMQPYEAQVKAYQKQVAEQQVIIDAFRKKLKAVRQKYTTARQQKRALIIRSRTAATRLKLAGLERDLDRGDYNATFEKLEQQVLKAEAQADATDEVKSTSIEAQLADFTSNDFVNARFNALKNKLGKQ